MDRYLQANAALSVFCRRYMGLKRGLPIRPSEMGVLNIISRAEGRFTPVQLAEMLGVSKPMITAHISSLHSQGYITKEVSAADRRAYYVIPTEKALALVEDVYKDMTRQLDQLIGRMGQENFDALVHLAQAAGEIMREEEEKDGSQ